MQFVSLRVAGLRRETRDAVVLDLEVPPEHRDAFRFEPGQHLTFRRFSGSEEQRRSYSICSGVNDGDLRVAIKRVAGGEFSGWANDTLQVGEDVEVMPPTGHFGTPIVATQEQHYLGIACGSGITPILGIIKSVLHGEPRSRFTLVYGNRASGTIMFREELEDLKNTFTSRFKVVHVLTREQQDVELFNGRITAEKCADLFRHWIDPSSIDQAFLCGPLPMVTAAAETLRNHGVDASRIRQELFFASQNPGQQRERKAVPATVSGDLCEATLVLDGRKRTIEFDKGSTTILEAALKAGIEAPYSCKAGVCSTCRAKVVQGDVDMDVTHGLEDYEIARGYVLTCQSYVRSKTVVVDYDQ